MSSVATSRLLLGAVLLAAALTSWYGLARQGLMTWDEGVYFDEARFVVQALNAVCNGGDIAQATDGFAPRMGRPLNTALNTLGEAVIGVHPWVPAALAGLWGTLCVYCTYVVGRRIYDERVGLLAAFLLLISPYFLQCRRTGLPEAAGTLAALLVLLRLLTLRERDWRHPWVSSLGLGLLLGVGFTINSRLGVLLPVAILFRVCWLQGAFTFRRALAHLAVSLLGVAVVMSALELPYRLLPVLVTSPVPVETYFQQLWRFAHTQMDMGRPPLHVACLAPGVFLTYFDAPALLCALVGVARSGALRTVHLSAAGGPGLLIACLLAQFLVLGLVAPFARYLCWVLPALMVLAAYGLARLAAALPPPLRLIVSACVLVVCLAHAALRAAPMLQARGAMSEAAAWLAGRPVAGVVTSDQSIAMAYTDLPLYQLPSDAREARELIARTAAHGPCYVLLDRQQFIRGTFVMSGDEYARSAGGGSSAVRPVGNGPPGSSGGSLCRSASSTTAMCCRLFGPDGDSRARVKSSASARRRTHWRH